MLSLAIDLAFFAIQTPIQFFDLSLPFVNTPLDLIIYLLFLVRIKRLLSIQYFPIVTVMLQHLKRVFLAQILISSLSCFQRADYNLPLFTFAYFLWDYKSNNAQKNRLFYLFINTWVVDFVWLIYWGITWSSAEYKRTENSAASGFVLIMSMIGFITKMVIIIMAYLYDQEVKPAITNFVLNLKSVFTYSPQRSY